jgi:aminopeptidase YwaD
MMNPTVRLVIFFTLSVYFTNAQRLNKADRAIQSNLHAHISYLADDKLEGRRAGTKGEQLASDYISSQFAKAGLQPKGDNNGWLQTFDIYDGKQVNSSTHFIINDNDLKLGTDYFPLSYSANKSTEAAVSLALPERGVPWFFDVKDLLEDNKDNPHFDLNEELRNKAQQSSTKGATAVIFYNSSDIADDLSFDGKEHIDPVSIPVLYISKDVKKKFFSDESAMVDMKLKVDIGDKMRQGHNVIGYIDNNAPTTIVLGAHYDHLGYGEDGNSMVRNERAIHNGADDNASGTAALIELARLLKQSKAKKNNYLFVAFSAEELGLNGSKFFLDHATVDTSSMNYMINMDMVGRLNDTSKALTIGGYGTSPQWASLVSSAKDSKYFAIKFDSSGTGPSDHMSFYRKGIPVLFFFTGLHSDYHRPSDDFDKINYTGEVKVVRLIQEVIEKSSNSGKLAFTKTREVQMGGGPRFNVTLGIMPDYTYSGAGVRVDGVSSGKAAEKAGMKAGDIIVELGTFKTTSLETYMKALSEFKKGDKTSVKFKRGNETLEAPVEF